jgi:hypothetical protein
MVGNGSLAASSLALARGFMVLTTFADTSTIGFIPIMVIADQGRNVAREQSLPDASITLLTSGGMKFAMGVAT